MCSLSELEDAKGNLLLFLLVFARKYLVKSMLPEVLAYMPNVKLHE